MPGLAGECPLIEYNSLVSRPEQIVILAAGLGSRLTGAEGSLPKPLVEVAGLPLIAHALAHAEASGCREAVIVVGHQGARVRQVVEGLKTSLGVRFVETGDPSAPNGNSLLAAAPVARSRFYLQMVDHVFAQPVLPLLDRGHFRDDEAGRLLVDPSPDVFLDLEDATRVQLEGKRIVAIGKGLPAWDAVDTGCFLLSDRVFDALRDVPAGEPRTVSSAMRRLVAEGALWAVSIGGIAWADVDTPADLESAQQALSLGSCRG